MDGIVTLKRCKGCGDIKPINQFHKHPQMNDGHLNFCKICFNSKLKRYAAANPEKVKQQKREINKRYNDIHREQKNAHNKVYAEALRKTKEFKRKHSRSNTNYDLKRKRVDVCYKLKLALRTRISNIIRGKKVGSAVNDLGCSIEYFKSYIESQFRDGMSWENYGRHGWHIDHIKPLSMFELTDPEDFREACHYTNLQPLWWYDNLSKSNKLAN